MPKQYADDFKRDVVALARQGGVTQRQIAKDFGISKSALSAWFHKAELAERGLSGFAPDARPAGGDYAVALREALKADPVV